MEQERFKSEILPQRDFLLGYAVRMLGDRMEAEDVVQEVFLKLWDMRAELDRYDPLGALAVTMVRNRCLNRMKVLKRNAGEVPLRGRSYVPQMALEQREGVTRVMGLIDGLPEGQRIILKMKHLDGMEVEDIAEVTGCSAEAVRMSLSRSRRRLKELFIKTEI